MRVYRPLYKRNLDRFKQHQHQQTRLTLTALMFYSDPTLTF